MKVKIRRQWNDWCIAKVDCEKIRNIHWDRSSGGVNAPAPQYFIYTYVWCEYLSCYYESGLRLLGGEKRYLCFFSSIIDLLSISKTLYFTALVFVLPIAASR
jgi:hypothetical protein